MAEIHVAGLVVREVDLALPGCECGRHHVGVWVAAEENIDCWAVIFVVEDGFNPAETLLDDDWGDLAATVIVAYGRPWAELTPSVMQRQLATISQASPFLAHALMKVPLGELRRLREFVRGSDRELGVALALGQAYRESVQ